MHPNDFRPLLASEAAAAGFQLSDQCLDRLAGHYHLLVKWNRAVRLIGDTDPLTVIRRHILESLHLSPFIREPRGSLLDIGSGNGYPAIALKCALPDLRVGLVEPTIRKSIFLSTAIGRLDLADTEVVRGRVDRPQDLTRLGRWDCISMRAVAAIPSVLTGGPSALRPGGRLLFMVGDAGRAEILRRIQAPLEIAAIHHLPGTRGSFIVVVSMPAAGLSETVH